MPADYYRIDLRIPPEWNRELELLQKEAQERTGKYVSKGDLIREMMKKYLEPSSSCILLKTKT